MHSNQRSASETTRRVVVANATGENGSRGRTEFSNEDNRTLHVHAYARVQSAARSAPAVRSSARRASANMHGG